MEIMRSNFDVGYIERRYALGFDVDYTVLMLERTFDTHEAAARNDDAILFESVGGEDDVGDPGFVFEGEKDEAFGGSGALARNDAAGNTDVVMVG
jgi:hypothetical protein